MVEDQTKFANKIHGLLSDNGITWKVKPLNVEGREFLWDDLLGPYLDVIDTLTEQITQIEAAIEDRAGSPSETQLLMTIPGVSYYSALLIYSELDKIEQFDSHKEVGSFMGLNPTIRESGDSRIEGGISKRGSGRVRWILVQGAYSAVYNSEDEYLSQFFHRLESRMNSKKAIVATARKLLVSMYYMLDREEVYDPPGMSSLSTAGLAALSGRLRPA